ncbi:CusA/CzcA family heavy metal efflux RND transporter [Runella sp. CRIBMP]|uniref:efflux RND transporter permease subunit n=1 Tax=Runella sp. CRIBMP TaxID=2683261 RepID=UPI00141222DB|nr:efflux RND transporter permease subunit [Runella sp. CRIBMP]NBB22699.1 CusA/CzcA family heavy metal efflux RND transporter [Runella sp. CRIBMP]
MLDRIIKFSLHNRLLVIALSAMLLVYGVYVSLQLPIDVLPDLNRPRVTVFLESNGLAPEEIETQVVLPVETALNGAPGVETVRSTSAIGLGMVFVEFDWNVEIYKARQLVAEKLQTVQLPNGITPIMGPISSVMGQIMYVGVSADTTNPADLRTLADFSIRRRLLSIKGVSQVIPIGGERRQYQVQVSGQRLKQYKVSLDQVENALSKASQNTSGNFYYEYGSEVLIRNIGRAQSLEDLANTVVTSQGGVPILLSQVADVKFGSAFKRGDGSINGKPAVILAVEKQPGANTVGLTKQIEQACSELQRSLPKDITINPSIFQQSKFIQASIDNVLEALRDGFILVVIVLFLFLMNLRTTVITLTAIPLSLVITALIFKAFDLSINTLTLGGLAIAIGELVDDAIVDVENVFRRLRENQQLDTPKSTLRVVYEASSEVRNSIVYATVIVVLVFIPLFYMEGIEGRIFAPLGIAYITSITASLFVSLTLTPVLCSYFLKIKSASKHSKSFWNRISTLAASETDTRLVRWLKTKDTHILHWSLNRPKAIIGTAIVLILISLGTIPFFGTEFLPPFNEGAFTVNLIAPTGTSLEESNKIGTLAEKLMLQIPEVEYASRRTGRAELDEHVEPVSRSEIDVTIRPDIERSRSEIIADIRKKLSILKGVSVGVGQPISHRIEHLLSGVQAQVVLKIYGNDLAELRSMAQKVQATMQGVEGVTDLAIERQTLVPQLLIRVRRNDLQRFGLQAGKVTEELEVFYNGKITGQIYEGQKSFDILIRTNERERSNLEAIRNTQISTPEGELIPLHQIADIEQTMTVNQVVHENTQRRMVVSANVHGRDLGSTVEEIKQKMSKVSLPQGYFIVYSGLIESQESASQLIIFLAIFSILAIFLVLYTHFKSIAIVLQIMLNIPLALIGSVVAVMLTGGTFSVATLVGFITLTGIASRNGIMMISHYIHLVEKEGETFSKPMIIRGSLERLVPVLMTALVAALALVPLTLDPQAAGKEILYPVATVILGGLLSSTFLDIIVTPVVFYTFGKKALQTYFSSKNKQDILS